MDTSIIHEPVIIPLDDHGLELDAAAAHLRRRPEDLDLLLAEGRGGHHGVAALVGELGHGVPGHELEHAQAVHLGRGQVGLRHDHEVDELDLLGLEVALIHPLAREGDSVDLTRPVQPGGAHH